MSNVLIFSLFFYWLKPSKFAFTVFLVGIALIFGFLVDKLFVLALMGNHETPM